MNVVSYNDRNQTYTVTYEGTPPSTREVTLWAMKELHFVPFIKNIQYQDDKILITKPR